MKNPVLNIGGRVVVLSSGKFDKDGERILPPKILISNGQHFFVLPYSDMAKIIDFMYENKEYFNKMIEKEIELIGSQDIPKL
ncbi:MAG: hypothetical protein PHH85_12605 [Candidatus Methanoperedens sp.]|nr:hypothetical protein [Candidatus Methanoperedens sp.]